MAYGDCSGKDLPKKKRTVNCQESVTQLDDCCEVVNMDDEVMLYEHVRAKDYYYWFFLKADDNMPMVVCALEQYADKKVAYWLGRKADYLAIGWYQGYCCIVLIELRHVLLSEEQETDKLKQLEESLETLVNKVLPTFKRSAIFQEACYPPPPPQECRIVGVVVPPDRSKLRLNRKKSKQIGEYQCFMTSLPSDRLTECRISWSELLDAIGVVSSGNPP
jgi:hypothetical protein